MKTYYLFPHSYRKIGRLISIPAIIVDIIALGGADLPRIRLPFLGLPVFRDDFMDELLLLVTLIGLLLIAFSKERQEDECIIELRQRALVYAILGHYAALSIGTLCLTGLSFLTFLYINLFTPLILFIIVFNLLLYRFKHLQNGKYD